MAAGVQPIPVSPDTSGNQQILSAPRRTRNGEIWVTTTLMTAAAFYSATRVDGGNSWLLVASIMVVFFLCLGRWICGRPLGILISERNVMSLSRFQVIIWTLVILSAFITIAAKRTYAGVPDALNLTIDWHLWALMGISTASIVGSPLILQAKKDTTPAPTAIEKAADALNESAGSVASNRQGTLYSNASPLDARFTDVFQGDEIANTAYIDITKLQMFAFTVIVAGAYAYQIRSALYITADKLQFPPYRGGSFPYSPGVVLLGSQHDQPAPGSRSTDSS